MPTEINGYSPSEETALSSLIINEVDSNETFEKMKEKGILQDNQLYLVTDEQGGGTYYTAGEVDTLLQNKAPAGYGLGASSKNVTDWNNEKTNGWVRDPSGTEDKHSPFIGLFSVGLISDYLSGGDTFQLAFARNQYAKTRTYIKFRAYNADDKVWGEWEWVNPPMIPGEEYRTTERYLGKPVYVKAVDFGALPNTTTKHVDIDNKNHARAIRVSGLLNNGATIPGTDENQTNGSKPLQCYGYNNNVCIYAPYDASSKTAVVTAWYMKTTD